MLNCPHCGSDIPIWISIVFVRVADSPCTACGHRYRLNRRGLTILFGGGTVTALLVLGVIAAAASPLSPLLVASSGLLLTGGATRRFGELVKKED